MNIVVLAKYSSGSSRLSMQAPIWNMLTDNLDRTFTRSDNSLTTIAILSSSPQASSSRAQSSPDCGRFDASKHLRISYGADITIERRGQRADAYAICVRSMLVILRRPAHAAPRRMLQLTPPVGFLKRPSRRRASRGPQDEVGVATPTMLGKIGYSRSPT
jgi:hypothetical protein